MVGRTMRQKQVPLLAYLMLQLMPQGKVGNHSVSTGGPHYSQLYTHQNIANNKGVLYCMTKDYNFDVIYKLNSIPNPQIN